MRNDALPWVRAQAGLDIRCCDASALHDVVRVRYCIGCAAKTWGQTTMCSRCSDAVPYDTQFEGCLATQLVITVQSWGIKFHF
jgi:hypothetical protein